uniref:RNA methyltransferase n=1 Tax=Steinernema glaseri TaxID=37863 RepID=A0A1I8AJ53_9BILA
MSAESEHPGPSCEAEDAPVEKTNKSNKYVENGKPGPSTEKDVQKQEANGAEVTGGQNSGSAADDAASQKQKRSLKDARYRYGNYNRYYGSRLKDLGHDPRLDKLPKSWFRYKSVLDIGCNVGYLTIELAKNFGPWRVVGIDIDDHLVGVARKNIRHYCDKDVELAGKYPASFKNPPETDLTVKFPDNVWFYKENYVLDEDWMLDSVQPEYDVILALSITKWIHLNWGDDGVKRFFRRVFKHLRPGGKFIVEPQEFSSYKKKSRLTPEINANYKAIKFLPEHFDNFLVNNVGFVTCQSLGIPKGARKGFDRPLVVYHKRDPRSKKTFGEPGQTGGWDPLFTKEREQLGKQKGVKRPLENSSTDEEENPAKKADK